MMMKLYRRRSDRDTRGKGCLCQTITNYRDSKSKTLSLILDQQPEDAPNSHVKNPPCQKPAGIPIPMIMRNPPSAARGVA